MPATRPREVSRLERATAQPSVQTFGADARQGLLENRAVSRPVLKWRPRWVEKRSRFGVAFPFGRAPFGYVEIHRTEQEQQRPRAQLATGGASPERLTLTVDEVAVVLGISRSSAYESAKRGEIPTVRFGRRIVIPRRAVLALLGEADDES